MAMVEEEANVGSMAMVEEEEDVGEKDQAPIFRLWSHERMSQHLKEEIASFLWYPSLLLLAQADKALSASRVSFLLVYTMCLKRMLRLSHGCDISLASLLSCGANDAQMLFLLASRLGPCPTAFDAASYSCAPSSTTTTNGNNNRSDARVPAAATEGGVAKDEEDDEEEEEEEEEEVWEDLRETVVYKLPDDIEDVTLPNGVRCIAFQGRSLGGNRTIGANSHFPCLALSISLEQQRALGKLEESAASGGGGGGGGEGATRSQAKLRSYFDEDGERAKAVLTSRVPFTQVIATSSPTSSSPCPTLKLRFSCVAYYEITLHDAMPPLNARKYSEKWLEDNPPCIAIGLGFPSEGAGRNVPRGGFELRKRMPGWTAFSYGYHRSALTHTHPKNPHTINHTRKNTPKNHTHKQQLSLTVTTAKYSLAMISTLSCQVNRRK